MMPSNACAVCCAVNIKPSPPKFTKRKTPTNGQRARIPLPPGAQGCDGALSGTGNYRDGGTIRQRQRFYPAGDKGGQAARESVIRTGSLLSLYPDLPRLAGRRFCLGKIRIKQIGNVQTKTASNFVERQQAGVSLDSQFVKLKQFVANAAFFGGGLLRPSARFSQRQQFFLEPGRNRILHPSKVQFAI